MSLVLRGKELRSAFAKLKALITEGYSDEEIASEQLGISFEEFEDLKQKYLDHEVDIALKKPSEHTYVEYVLEQQRCISDLDNLIKSFGLVEDEIDDDLDESYSHRKQPKARNIAGYVGAVRAKSDIIDKIVKTGQEFGLIEQKDKAKANPGDVIFNMSKVEIIQYLTSEMKCFSETMMRYGDRDITTLDVGPIHQPIPKVPMLKDKQKKRKPKTNG